MQHTKSSKPRKAETDKTQFLDHSDFTSKLVVADFACFRNSLEASNPLASFHHQKNLQKKVWNPTSESFL